MVTKGEMSSSLFLEPEPRLLFPPDVDGCCVGAGEAETPTAEEEELEGDEEEAPRSLLAAEAIAAAMSLAAIGLLLPLAPEPE